MTEREQALEDLRTALRELREAIFVTFRIYWLMAKIERTLYRLGVIR